MQSNLNVCVQCTVLVDTSTETTKLDKLFKLQKRALRICTHSHYLSHSKYIFHKLNTLNIFDINKLQIALFMYRFTNDNLPNSFKGFFTKNKDLHNYNTRNADKYITSNYNLNSIRNSIKYAGPILWNSLQNSLVNYKTINIFKSKYKSQLISHYN